MAEDEKLQPEGEEAPGFLQSAASLPHVLSQPLSQHRTVQRQVPRATQLCQAWMCARL